MRLYFPIPLKAKMSFVTTFLVKTIDVMNEQLHIWLIDKMGPLRFELRSQDPQSYRMVQATLRPLSIEVVRIL